MNKVNEILRGIAFSFANLSEMAKLKLIVVFLLVVVFIMACVGCGVSAVLPPVVESPPVNDWKPLVATQLGYACLESAGRDSGPQTIHAGETAGFVARMEFPEY